MPRFFCACLTSSSDLGLQNLSFTASIVGEWGSKGLGEEVEFATNIIVLLNSGREFGQKTACSVFPLRLLFYFSCQD